MTDEKANVKDELEKAGKRARSKGVKLIDIKLANAVKLQNAELTYFSDEHFDIYMTNNLVISIRKKLGGNQTVYTSVMNAISWRH